MGESDVQLHEDEQPCSSSIHVDQPYSQLDSYFQSGPNLSTPPKIPSIIPRNSDPCLPTIPLLSPRKPNNQSPKCSPRKQNNSFSSKSEKDFTPNKYDDIVKYFRKLKTNFVDDSFRPCDQSIFGDSVSSDRSIVWKRPHEVDSSNEIKWTIFRTPLPTDIVQGSLGKASTILFYIIMYRQSSQVPERG